MNTQNGKEVAEIGGSFENMKTQATILLKSGFLPPSIKTAEQAIAIMLVGRELGLGFMESVRSINVVQGRPCMSAQLLLALCHRTKEVEQAYFERQTDVDCTFVLKRKGSPAYKAIWSIQRAAKLLLDKKDNWQKQPKNMLSWRAISEAARVVFPDAVCGLYTTEEAESIAVDPGFVQEPISMPKPKNASTEAPAEAIHATHVLTASPEPPNAEPDPYQAVEAEVGEPPLPEGFKMITAAKNCLCKSKACTEEIKVGQEVAFSPRQGTFHRACL